MAAASGADRVIVNHEDCNKEAPIHIASRCGNIEVLELLIDHGADMSLVDSKGRTCLHCATQSDYHACIDFLLSTGCKFLIDERDDQGYSCLHIAVKGNKFESVRTLLEHGASIDAITVDGKSTFNLAQMHKSDKMMQLLLQFDNQLAIPTKINETPCNDDIHVFQGEATNLFEGLTLFDVSRGVRTPHKESAHNKNNESHTDELSETFSTPFRNNNAGSNHDQGFYITNELWFICFSSGHHYFLRASDSYSQVS